MRAFLAPETAKFAGFRAVEEGQGKYRVPFPEERKE